MMVWHINKKKHHIIGFVLVICNPQNLSGLENKSAFLSLAESDERVLIHLVTEKFSDQKKRRNRKGNPPLIVMVQM